MNSSESSHPSAGPGLPISSMTLSPREFATISALAKERFGLELGAGKEQLVAARIGKIARILGFRSFRDYYQHVQDDNSGQAIVQLIDALTTNHTSFFREQAHFDFLVRQILPARNKNTPMSIWSSACSTGEEPYSIALTLREQLGPNHPALPHILATDISTRALETAQQAVYSAERFQGKPAPWLHKHLLRGEGKWTGYYRMRPEILSMISFGRLNLIEPLPAIGPFELILCRNVMIYFSRATQEKVVAKLSARLQPGGYLFVGHSEGLTGMNHNLQQIQPAIYRKRGAAR